jgi:glycosidase
VILPEVHVWSHEIDFWGGDLRSAASRLDYLSDLGIDVLYLNPIHAAFTNHKYDATDYLQVSPEYGTFDDLRDLTEKTHRAGMKLVLDGVFNHVGRDFWAFRDVQAHGQASPYAGWFAGLRFDQTNQHGDPFSYEGWAGHTSLVKLNLQHPEVRSHLWEAITTWLREWDPDGLRLDAADHLPPAFLQDLGRHCRGLKPGFWLMGEVVAGDYRRYLQQDGLDAVTNYEAYKGLFSSHNDANYFEIAYTLRRQFGHYGLCQGRNLYSFADNHDVDRLASRLTNPAHLYPVYCLLFTMPGAPSIYYGS